MNEHTKTPWVYVDDGYSGSIWSTVDGKPFVRVASFLDCEVSDETEPTARHIVHCVNNHERLVEALNECRGYFLCQGKRGAGGYLDKVADMVDDALEKLDGEQ